jgi:hypothetical protein
VAPLPSRVARAARLRAGGGEDTPRRVYDIEARRRAAPFTRALDLRHGLVAQSAANAV